MARFRDGFDEQALGELVTRYQRSAYVLARCRLGDERAAEDAVQEAFIRVVRHRRRYNPLRPFAPWFHELLRNVCLDSRRSHWRHRRKLQEFASAAADAREEARPGAWPQLLEGLSADERELLVLRFVEGYSFPAIASLLGCSEEAVKKRSQRALSKARRCVLEDGSVEGLGPARAGVPAGVGGSSRHDSGGGDASPGGICPEPAM
ncbi:MAG: sigma-70 family RNA polymerase sigma factor [Lentisphaeria bacterium]|nr:sigma-70 family RNA polymerase sigma factor [Lentisphaeria bacterium]